MPVLENQELKRENKLPLSSFVRSFPFESVESANKNIKTCNKYGKNYISLYRII
jgi:hypothetical protein